MSPIENDGEVGRDLYAATAPLTYAERQTGRAWFALCDSLSVLLDPVALMVRDDEDGNAGWTALATPHRCPLPWLVVLAQWAGIRRWDAMDEDDLRELIGPRAPGVWRGTRAAMIAAVRRHMPPGTADRYLYFQERADGDPYLLRVFTFTFIDHDPEQVRDGLEDAKPALLNLIYEVRRGQTWGMLNQRAEDWQDVRETYRDWAAVLNDEPVRSSA